jgi:hypothetical protein
MLLAPQPNPNTKCHYLSVTYNCLFNIFVATFHIENAVSFIYNLRTCQAATNPYSGHVQCSSHRVSKSHFNITLPCMIRSPKWPLPFRFLNQNAYISHSTNVATCPNCFILHLVTLILLRDMHKLWCSRCNLLHFPVTSSFLGLNIFLCTFFQMPLIWVLSLEWETHFTSCSCKTTGKTVF